MYHVLVLNKISRNGLDRLGADLHISDVTDPDVILVRSESLHTREFGLNLKAVGRAGAGVNNIPVDALTQKGVVVFNTPGANANAVKEMVLGSMIVAARNMIAANQFVSGLSVSDEIHSHVEKMKSTFKGTEVQGKRLTVVGLGAVGTLVANSAIALGLEVNGYDPFISVDKAWGLSNAVIRVNDLESAIRFSDFISIHVPLVDQTRGLFSYELISKMKPTAILINFSREGIVDEPGLIQALDAKCIRYYVSDFPSNAFLTRSDIILFPHLGASTQEAEDQCAIMVADQVRDYLLNGNVRNAVNFPDCVSESSFTFRVVVGNRNVPNMVGQITAILAAENVNILQMMNRSKGDVAYNIVDIDVSLSEHVLYQIAQIDGVLMVRLISR